MLRESLALSAHLLSLGGKLDLQLLERLSFGVELVLEVPFFFPVLLDKLINFCVVLLSLERKFLLSFVRKLVVNYLQLLHAILKEFAVLVFQRYFLIKVEFGFHVAV